MGIMVVRVSVMVFDACTCDVFKHSNHAVANGTSAAVSFPTEIKPHRMERVLRLQYGKHRERPLIFIKRCGEDRGMDWMCDASMLLSARAFANLCDSSVKNGCSRCERVRFNV